MTNKQLNDYVTMKNISNISDQKKKGAFFYDIYAYTKCTKKKPNHW